MSVLPIESRADFQASDVLGQFNSDGSPNFTNQYSYGKGPNAVGFSDPGGIVLDGTNHRLYIADGQNCRILIFSLNTSNELEDDTADYVLGGSNLVSNFCSEDVTAANFYQNGASTQLALDESGQRLFVSDSGNYRVLIFDVATITNGENAIHVLGAPNLTTAGEGTISASNTSYTGGMAYDPNNDRLFYADNSFGRISVFDLSVGITDGMDASFVIGQPDFDTEGGDFDSLNASSTLQAQGIVYDTDTDYLYVGSYAGDGGRVTVFDVNPGIISNNPDAIYVLGQANFVATSTTVNSSTLSSSVYSLALDLIGQRLYVGTVNRVLVFDIATLSDGEPAVNVLGQDDFVSNIDKKNDVLSIDSYNTDASTIGQPYLHYYGSKLFVTDSGSNRVLVFDVASITNGEDAVDVLGQKENGVDSFTKPAENDANLSLGFLDTAQLIIDEVDHRLFVLDGQARVLVFNLDTNNRLLNKVADYVLGSDSIYREGIGSTTPDHLSNAQHIAYSSKQKLLFVQEGGNQYGIRVFDLSSGITTGMNASYILGASSFNTYGGGESATRFYSYNVVVDDYNDYLYVFDHNQGRGVLVFDISDGVSTDMPASFVLGEGSLTGAGTGGYPTADTLSNTNGAVYDPDSHYLYIGDSNRVMVYDLSSGISTGMSASYVLGQSNFTTATIGTTQSKFELVEDLAFDNENKILYVSDSTGSNGNYRIMVFDVNSISNGENAVAVIGKPNFTQTGQSTLSASSFDGNRSISFASTTRTLFVSDSYGRILLFNMIDFASDTLSSGTVGTAYSGGFTATSSQGTVTYELVSGTLPEGLSLNTSTGSITGTPTSATSSTIRVKIIDTLSAAQTFYHTQEFTLTVSAAAPVSTPTVSPSRSGGGRASERVNSTATKTIEVTSSIPQVVATAKIVSPSIKPTTFVRSLTLNSSGADVRILQQFLNSQGFVVSTTGYGSPGNETFYFGPATRAALVRYQKANNITPAVGYFGPITRKMILRSVTY